VCSSDLDHFPAEVASAILARVNTELNEFQANGWSSYKDLWQRWHALLGTEVKVIAGDDVQDGVVVGLSDSGALILQPSGGGEEILFHAGEVHLLPNSEGRTSWPK